MSTDEQQKRGGFGHVGEPEQVLKQALKPLKHGH